MLLLHRDGLAPSTPCRSPGALPFRPQPEPTPIRTVSAKSYNSYKAAHLGCVPCKHALVTCFRHDWRVNLETDVLSVCRRADGIWTMNDHLTSTSLQSLDAIDRHRVLTDHPAHLIRRSYQIFLFCFDEAMAGLRLTPVTWIILATAHNFPDLSVTELARRAAVDKASCGRAAAVLQKRGLLKIEMSRSDGRQKVLNLTPAGDSLVQKGFARVEKLRSLILAKLDAEEAHQLVTNLTSFVLKSATYARPSIPTGFGS